MPLVISTYPVTTAVFAAYLKNYKYSYKLGALRVACARRKIKPAVDRAAYLPPIYDVSTSRVCSQSLTAYEASSTREDRVSSPADISDAGLARPAAQYAAVFCIDEKTAIQALDRLDPVLPLSPGRAERHGFEY